MGESKGKENLFQKAQVKGAKTNTPSQGSGRLKILDAEASLHHQDLTKELQRREGEEDVRQAVYLLPRAQAGDVFLGTGSSWVGGTEHSSTSNASFTGIPRPHNGKQGKGCVDHAQCHPRC